MQLKRKTKSPCVNGLYWLPKLHKNPIKQDLLPILVLVRQKNLKWLTSCLTAVKNMLSSIVKRYMKDPVKTYFGLLKIQVKFQINLKLEISM